MGARCMSVKSVRLIMDIVVFTVLVFAATIVVQVYQPATGGYFNLSEAVIYVAAMVSSPIVAGIAGGVGAGLADVVTGYGIFAPATLVIKFTEGYVAGLLVRRLRSLGKTYAIVLGVAVAVVYGLVLAYLGANYFSGELFLGPEWASITVTLPVFFWLAVAGLVFLLIVYLALAKRHHSVEALGLMVAGLIMVTGYFLYEYFVSNPLTGREPLAALAEIPVNIGQAVIGASIALPVVMFLRRAGYVE